MNHFIKLGGLLTAAILFLLPAFAQEIKGMVTDSTGKAVAYANINLRNKTGDAILVYTTTDTRGIYILRLPANTLQSDLYLEARCIGYKTQTRVLNNLPAEIDFTLGVSYNQLDAVIVRGSHRPLLRTNGDTLSYKVTDFSSVQDRVIGDVIKRLPGISVAADGTISYNNKPVSGVYISGDNLLDDKYSIATNTIPNGVVDKVQVIENHQPIKVLQNKIASNDVAINLTFTRAKLRPLGQETVGAGLPGNYYADFNALLLKDQFKAIHYFKSNNTGEDLQQDLVSHNGAGYQKRTGNDDLPAAILSLGSLNDPNLSRTRYLINRAGILNVNDLVNFKNGLQLRVNAYYLRDKQQQDYSLQTNIFLPADTVRYTEIQHNQFNPTLLHAQFTLNVNTEKYYVNNALTIDDNRSVNYSDLHTNGSLLNQVLKNHSSGFSNEFNLVRSVQSKNIIEAYSYTSHLDKPETRTIGPGYNATIFNNGIPYAQLIQDVNVPTWYTNSYISFKIPGKILTQSFKSGFSMQSQTLTAALSVLQSGNGSNPAFDSAVNHLAWNKKKLYAEAAYDIPVGKFRASLSLPFTFQQLNYSDTGYALKKELARLYFNPELNIKYQTGIENFVTLQYSYLNGTGGISAIYQGYILKDYRTLYANNADLTLQQNHRVGVGFSYRKSLTLFFFNINASYHHTRANNIASGVISNNFQQRVVLPFPNSTSSFAATGSTSKYSFAWRTSFTAMVQWQDSRSVQFQNGALLPFHTTAETLMFSAETKLSRRLSASYRITGTQTSSHSPAAVSTVRIDQLLQQAAIYFNPSASLQFKLTGEHYFTKRQGNAGLKYFFADMSVKYRIKKRGIDLQLDAANFLNVKTYNAFYLSANTFTASSYTLPGRIILVKLLFSL